MNQRERLLSMLVGGLLVVSALWWLLGKYQSAIKVRTNQVASLKNRQQELSEQRLQGEYANRQMGEYIVRSLPSDPELAQSRYQKWLIGVMLENGITEQSVDPTSSRLIGDLYRQFSFRAQGNAQPAGVVTLLYAFYQKDYLHRIRNFSLQPNRSGLLRIEMTIDAIALQNAPENLAEPQGLSWQVVDSAESYLQSILNRNLYQPPNQAPVFAGKPTAKSIVAQQTSIPLRFEDPEGHPMRFELVENSTGDRLSDQVQIDGQTGTLTVQSDQVGVLELVVRATDQGYPTRSTQQKLVVNITKPPEPEPQPKPKAKKLNYDDAKQTVLTGLVQGRGEWTAWLNVRTRDKTLKLRVGDAFEIGSVKGTVLEVDARSALLDLGGRRTRLKLFGNLVESANAAQRAK